MKIRLILILVCSNIIVLKNVYSQLLPYERKTDWSKAGIDTINFEPIDINIIDYGGDSTGNNINTNALDSAINAILLLGGGTIYFPPGIYLFNSTQIIPSGIKIKGAGIDKTIFLFNNQGNGDCFSVVGNSINAPDTIISGYIKDSQVLKVNDASIYQAHQYIKIIENDDGRIFSSWASNSIGQIVMIDSVNLLNNEIYIHQPLRQTYSINLFPRIYKMYPATNVGFECFTIKRIDQSNYQTSNFTFYNAANCYVFGIKSELANFSHINIEQSSNIQVSNSYFKEAHNYGSGGMGYGIMIQSTSGACLIENNQFEHLRHSIILQSSANGNVISYNYSKDPYWTGTILPSNAAGDIVLHGNYPYMNLFEGNICQNIVIDNSHGVNGPYNTFFRNRAELYGIFMNNNPASDKQNFIANEITNPLLGLYSLQGNGHFEYGNNRNGTILPSGTDTLSLKSFYLSSIPLFWDSIFVWPSIGIDNVLNLHTIPAFRAYQNNLKGDCYSTFDTIYKHFIICPSQPFIFNNHVYTQEGIYIDSVIDFKNDKYYLKIIINVLPQPIISFHSSYLHVTGSIPVIKYSWYHNDQLVQVTTSDSMLIANDGCYYVDALDYNLCILRSDTLCITNSNVNNAVDDMLYIYPNPFYQFLNVIQNNNYFNSIKIYDMHGSLIFIFNELSNYQKLNLQNLSPGIYLFEFYNENFHINQYFKMIKLSTNDDD